MTKQPAREGVQGTQSIDRALSLLTAFSAEQPKQRVSDLVETTGLGQSTVSRMVAAMSGMGFLSHDPLSGLYSLGPEVVNLAGILLNDHPVHGAARQVAQDLAARLGLGVNVATRLGTHVFYLCNFEGVHAPRSSTLIGRGGPLHATALGKAMIADYNRDELEALVGTTFDRYTAKTITGLKELLQDLSTISEHGYAIENEELALRRACLATPIRGRGGGVVAAISVSGPLSVINLPDRQDELAMILIEQADQISTALGYVARAASS